MTIYEDIYKLHGLSASQEKIIELVGNNEQSFFATQNKKVLEIGSSSGYMTNFFKKNGCLVDVVELDKLAAKKIKGARKIVIGSIEDDAIYSKLSEKYDFIVMADVLEHLVNPDKTLKMLGKISNTNTRLIISLPNIASWPMRKQLFFKGDFEYQMSGLLDKTHLHFYTVNSLPKFLKDNGWEVEKLFGTIIIFPLMSKLSKLSIFKKLAEKFKNLSYYHFVTVAKKV